MEIEITRAPVAIDAKMTGSAWALRTSEIWNLSTFLAMGNQS